MPAELNNVISLPAPSGAQEDEGIDLWDETKYSLDDKGNGDRFADLFGDLVRYTPKSKQWYLYVGTHWQRVHQDRMLNLAKRLASDMQRTAPGGLDLLEKDHARRIRAHLNRLGSVRMLEDTLKVGRAHPKIAMDESEFDRSIDLLNVANGTVDLRTGHLRRHDPADHFTTVCETQYDPAAVCPTWLRFLGQITGGEQSLSTYLQIVLGYCATGHVREQRVFVLYGTGGNGKSTLLGVIQDILSGLAQTATANLLIKTRYESPAQASGYIARLRNKRFVIVSESKEGQHWDEALVKRITGNEVITARDLYEKESEFRPTHHLLVDTNYLPLLDGVDPGIKRRVVIVPFRVSFDPAKMDRTLRERLKAEASGILNWLVAGACTWFFQSQVGDGVVRSGLPQCDAVEDATLSFVEENDDVGQFISEMCVEDPNGRTELRSLNDQFAIFRDLNGSSFKTTTRSFGVKIRTRGYRVIKSNSRHYVIGLALRDSDLGSAQKC